MQKMLGGLTVAHLIEANDIVRDLRIRDLTLLFIKQRNPEDVMLRTLSDAAYPKDRDYSQTGFLIGTSRKRAQEWHLYNSSD